MTKAHFSIRLNINKYYIYGSGVVEKLDDQIDRLQTTNENLVQTKESLIKENENTKSEDTEDFALIIYSKSRRSLSTFHFIRTCGTVTRVEFRIQSAERKPPS